MAQTGDRFEMPDGSVYELTAALARLGRLLRLRTKRRLIDGHRIG